MRRSVSSATPGTTHWLVTSLGVLLGAMGCSGSGEGLDANGRPIGEGGGGTPPPAPPPPGTSDFQQIQDTIFTPACTGCHAGASAPRGLRLDAGNSYAMLVGVPSDEVPSLQRVQPGDAENSYLVHKIEGRAAVGARMPLGGPPLSQENIDLIKQWIVAGAPAPTAAASMSTLTKPRANRIVSSVPAPGEVSAHVDRLMLVFDQPVDAGLTQSGVFELTASGGDGSFHDGNEIALEFGQVTLSLANPTVVYLQPRQPLTPESYRFTLDGEGMSVATDVVLFTVVEAKR